MRHRFELFIRCLGLTLFSCGLLLAFRTLTQWLQPSADFSAFWNQIEHQAGNKGMFQSLSGPTELIDRSSQYAVLSDLVCLGVAPSLLGLLFLLRAASISSWFYPSEDIHGATPLDAAANSEFAASIKQKTGSREASGLRYAPPGDRT